ncbi:MAG: helix-turn-helix transcriptional regulator [Bacteroidales bacterium]
MVKNNHITSKREDIIEELESGFSAQPFASATTEDKAIEEALQILKAYVQIEHSVGVLSDLAANKSYICSGAFGQFIGLENTNDIVQIDSIWEEDIYNRIHPDDLFERHLLELKFFHFLRSLPTEARSKYSTSSRIRMITPEQTYQYIKHRTLFLRSTCQGSLWLALCLYNFSDHPAPLQSIDGKIINNETGESIPLKIYDTCVDILTPREKEILFWVGRGLLSKEISQKLNISLNTVNRHRQNIMAKLGVKNSTEAVKMALAMNLIE